MSAPLSPEEREHARLTNCYCPHLPKAMRCRVCDLAHSDAARADRVKDLEATIAVLQDRERVWVQQEVDLRKALGKAATRIEILVGRMRGCAEEPQKHDLSILEGEGWVEETRALLGGVK